MTIRQSARIAGLAIVAAEAIAVATRSSGVPMLILGAFVVLQGLAVGWATDRRSAATLTAIAPALLTAVTVAAAWTALAFAVPVIATDDAAALVAIVAAGLAVSVSPGRLGGRRLPLVLMASAGCGLLIFLAISWILPTVPGFVSNNHPPTYTDVTRMVDPVLEFAVFVLLVVMLAVDGLRARVGARRALLREDRPAYVAGVNEMVVEPDRSSLTGGA